MLTVAIAVALPHKRFGAIVLAFDETVGEASGQKIKEGQDFSPPIAQGRQGFAHLGWAISFDGSDPLIQACRSRRGRSRGIAATQGFLELPGRRDLGKASS